MSPDGGMHMEMMQKHGHSPMIPPGMSYGMYPHPKVLQARSNKQQKKKGKGGHRHQKSHDDMVRSHMVLDISAFSHSG